ncbi:MAG: hypothetical protein ACPLRY_03440 [Candidatus Bathyarchaeales archaeon]
MPKNTDYDFLVALALSLSFLGIALVLPLAIYKPTVQWSVYWRKPLMGLLFTLVCLFGIFAVFFPEKCSKTSHTHEGRKNPASEVKNANSHRVSIHFKGHHPDCGNFEDHLIKVNGRVLCAACTGLFIGALIVLAGSILYFFVEWNILIQSSLLTVLFGQAGVALGLFQFKFRGFTRSVLNAFFVVACFLMLVGVDSLTENVLLDLYLIGLILFWLFTRILISQRDHLLICRLCSTSCELKKERES